MKDENKTRSQLIDELREMRKRVETLTRPLEDVESIAFENLFNLSDIQQIQDLFADAFGVAALITHPDGTPITKPSNFAALCSQFIRNTEKGSKNCKFSDAMVGRHNPAGPNIQPCLSAGLCDAGASITVGGRHIANWLIGQVRNEIQEEEDIMAYARELGADESAFLDAYRQVPIMSQDQFERVAHMLFTVANQLSTSAYQNVQQARFIAERKRIEESLRLTQFIFDKAPIGIWKMGPNGEVLDVNEKGCARLGYSREELCRMTVSDVDPNFDAEVWTRSRDALEKLGSTTIESLHRCRSGEIFPIEVIQNLVRFEDQTFHVAFVQDITERKLMEDALKESEQRLELALSGANEGIWDWNIPEDDLYLDPRYYTMAGYRPDDFPATYDEILKRIHKDDLKRVTTANDQYLEGRLDAFEVEFRFQRKDGSYMWIRAKGKLVAPDDKGKPTRFIGTHADITERKRAEEALRENEQLLNNILESMNEGLLVLDRNFKCTIFNRSMANMVSSKKEHAIGKIPWEAFPVLKNTDVEKNIRKTMTGESAGNIEIQLPLPSGEMAWFRDSFSCLRNADGRIVGVVGVVSDITQRKQDEEELRSLIHQLKESETRYKALHNASFGGITIHDKGRILECNQGLSEITGYSVDELIGMDGMLLIAEESRKMVMDKIASGYEKPYEATGLRKNGEKFPIRLAARNIPYKGKQVRSAEFRDITEEKKAEAELRHLKNYLSNIIDSMPSVLVGVDRDGRVTQWNRQAEQVTGISVMNAQSRHLADVFPRLTEQMNNIKASIRERRVLRDVKVPIERQHETRYEDVTIFPLVANGVEGAVIRVDDVTQQVRLEEMMIQNEKMLSVGGLAAGMAHEINNPLAGIVQSAAVLENRLLGDLPANHKAAETAGTTLTAIKSYLKLRRLPDLLGNIRESGNRAAAIVRNMLSFARKSEKVASSHDLGALLDQTIELLRTDYNMKKHYDFKQVRVEREYDPMTSPVPCEAGKLQQVFMNILKNGAEAMTEATDAPEPPAFMLRVKNDGDWVRVEIEGNGPGMDEATRRRIFEPFFTTKPAGKGTGLGLSVSYFIIAEDHGGEMRVHETEGGGTRFVIRLPR
ncbi:PAS domain S-box protein [uncultured Desulfosarcina sp.]|uniref:PAS domain S-box protein n=1 Tax=uncultured Desulfosarcina sp. TaxID=218289 RepID=UPI0029C97638|nr:PAS domain S-box protein [uncultured Desulfosarcina sp.]